MKEENQERRVRKNKKRFKKKIKFFFSLRYSHLQRLSVHFRHLLFSFFLSLIFFDLSPVLPSWLRKFFFTCLFPLTLSRSWRRRNRRSRRRSGDVGIGNVCISIFGIFLCFVAEENLRTREAVAKQLKFELERKNGKRKKRGRGI